jgi:hypothetical protein
MYSEKIIPFMEISMSIDKLIRCSPILVSQQHCAPDGNQTFNRSNREQLNACRWSSNREQVMPEQHSCKNHTKMIFQHRYSAL